MRSANRPSTSLRKAGVSSQRGIKFGGKYCNRRHGAFSRLAAAVKLIKFMINRTLAPVQSAQEAIKTLATTARQIVQYRAIGPLVALAVRQQGGQRAPPR